MSDAFHRTGGPGGSGFGMVRRASEQRRRAQSLTLQEAAGNLLEKAYRALHDGDEQTARRYLHRAAALPWDEHEGVHPAAMEVHTTLFDEVTDAAEQSPRDDRGWLSAARHTVAELDAAPAEELRQVLAQIAQDHRLPRPERDAVREIVGGRPPNDDVTLGLGPSSTPDRVEAALDAAMRALVAFHRAYRHDA